MGDSPPRALFRHSNSQKGYPEERTSLPMYSSGSPCRRLVYGGRRLRTVQCLPRRALLVSWSSAGGELGEGAAALYSRHSSRSTPAAIETLGPLHMHFGSKVGES